MKRMLSIALAAALALPAAAAADAVYHTQHFELAPVAGEPLRSGFVKQTHANGPMVYGIDGIVLNGARPNREYLAVMFVFPFDPTCSGTPLAFQAMSVETNVAGNGRVGSGRISPDLIPPEVRGYVHGSYWVVFDGALPAYATSCSALPTD